MVQGVGGGVPAGGSVDSGTSYGDKPSGMFGKYAVAGYAVMGSAYNIKELYAQYREGRSLSGMNIVLLTWHVCLLGLSMVVIAGQGADSYNDVSVCSDNDSEDVPLCRVV